MSGKIIWLYGLSGAGKTTLALELKKYLSAHGIQAIHIDGDMLRSSLTKNLGFSEKDRTENIRIAAMLAKIMSDQGFFVICSFITPTNDMREMVIEIIGGKNLELVFLDTPLTICIDRDPKGLYRKALKGEIKNFTGISAEFERPDLYKKISTGILSPEESLNELLQIAKIKIDYCI